MAWTPPEKLLVSQWADRNRILDAKTSAMPGRWRTDVVPYLRDIMDSFTDPNVETITLCTATQVGKSEALNNCLGYAIAQDPGSSLVVYPTLDLGEYTSKNRIQPMIESSQVLRERWDRQRSEILELQFAGAYVCLSGANSPASLASRPIRYLFLDEVDKFPAFTGEEADPISLARERTKTFRARKILQASTPTTERGRIWREYESADVRRSFFVPCPHCGRMQKLILAQVKWPEEVRTAKREAKGDPLKLHDAAERALSSSWYECQYCGGLIDDSDKLDMLRKGEWRDDRATATPPRHVAFHLSSIYSPFVSFGQVASEFLQSEEFPDRLRNFINSWLGEPWRDTRVEVKGQELLAQEGDYHLGEVPAEAHFLTAAVDVQLDHFWWEVVAWGVGASSWIVDFGRAESWENLEDIIVNRQYPVKGGGLKQVRLCGVDSGYRADEVYQWCTAHSDVAKPVKGASQSLGGRFYSVSSLDKEGWAGLKLLITDTDYWKDYVFGRLRRTPGSPGAMHVPQNCPEYWAAHMTSEQKTVERNRKTGKEREVWVKISQHAPNHLLDCLVYSTLMAELCGVRYLSDVQEQHRQQEVEPERPTGSWLGHRKSWLRR
ncbi:MAG: terminase gpA endonuclease subunit [Methanoregulaceae archaeon]